MNIFEERQKVAFPVAQDGLVAALEEVADRSVLPVEVHGIALMIPWRILDRGTSCVSISKWRWLLMRT